MIYSRFIGRSFVGNRWKLLHWDDILGDSVDTKLVFRLQAIAQNGHLFASQDSDLERYREFGDIAAEMAVELGDVGLTEVTALFDAAGGYATPRVDVRGAVFEGERLLLVRLESEDSWVLPGGWAQPNASPSENVVAHLKGLLGGSVRVERLLTIWNNLSAQESLLCYPTYGIVFQCTASWGEGMPTDTAQFFTCGEVVDELKLTTAYQNRLERLFWLQQHSNCVPDFD